MRSHIEPPSDASKAEVNIHNFLDIPPTFRKRAVLKSELSDAQRDLLDQLGLKNDFNQKVLINDLNPQKTIVSFLHLSLMVELGVQIDGISRCMTAFQSYCFRDAIGKILELKRFASTPYFRSLAKSAANSSYGVTGLVPERFEQVGVAMGQREILRAISSPHLNRFKILSPTSILTYKQKESVKCDSLFFVNVAIQQHSKTYFLRSYYFNIKRTLTTKCLQLGLKVLSVQCEYCDTDSATISIKTDSFNDVGVHLRTSDILYELRHIIDFGNFLPHPNHSLFQELKSRLSDAQLNDFMSHIRSTQSAPGLFKSEVDVSGFSNEIEFFYTLRSKAYILKAAHRSTPDSNSMTYSYKKTLKGPILRERLKKLSTADYLAMGKGQSDYEDSMTKISNKNWAVYLTEMKRRRPTIFAKSRFLVDAFTGITRPHGHYSNPPTNRVSSVVIINDNN